MRQYFKTTRFRAYLAGITMVGLLGAVAATSVPANAPAAPKGKLPVQRQAERGTSYAQSLSTAFRAASETVLPSVVMIRTVPQVARLDEKSPNQSGDRFEKRYEFRGTPFGDFEGTPFEDMLPPELRRHFQEMPSMPGPNGRVPRGRSGVGSGVIIDRSGVILTNNHVVSGGGKVVVRLHDGREFEAVKIETDPKTDIAVVFIEEAEGLVAAELGDSESAQVGDWVLALGGPFGLEGTVTAGIVSAKGRGIGITDRENFLQTDAAINPGNSGGPLVNLDGQVVGINTAISSRSGGNQGVGFAVPANLARWVADQLIETGTVKRAYLGVVIQPVSHDLAKRFGVKAEQGVLVTDVQDETPAAKAGLKPGDVIVAFDGTEVNTPRELQGVVERAELGRSHAMEVIRDGRKGTLRVTVGQQPEDFGLAAMRKGHSPQPKAERAQFDKLGLDVEQLTDDVARRLGYENRDGVLITEVRTGSPADRAGLATGMLIAEVDRQKTPTLEQFAGALKKSSPKKGILMLVRDGNGVRFVVLEMDE